MKLFQYEYIIYHSISYQLLLQNTKLSKFIHFSFQYATVPNLCFYVSKFIQYLYELILWMAKV